MVTVVRRPKIVFFLSAALFLCLSAAYGAGQDDSAWSEGYVPSGGDARFPGLPGNIEILELENGLKVLLMRNPVQDMVSVVTQVSVGSAYEDFRTSGMSHMLEHLLFNGSEKYTQEEQYDLADNHGIWNNAHTSDFFTNFIVIQPADDLETGLDLQSQMLFHSVLPEQKFEKERGIVAGEIVQSRDDASNYVNDALRRTLYAGSSLALPTLGTLSTIENMARDDVMAFYRNHYVPNNMITTVAGNFDREQVIDLLHRYYGSVPPGTVERPQIKPAPYIERTHTVTRRGGESQVLVMAYEAPGYRSPDYFPFAILVRMLQSEGGILDRTMDGLPPEQRPGLSLWWEAATGYSRLIIQVDMPDGGDPTRYHNLVESAFSRAAEWGVTGEDLTRVVNMNETEVLIEREQLRHLAIVSAEQIAEGGIDFFINYLDELAAVQAQDVTRVISAYLVDSPHLNLHVLPLETGGDDAAAPGTATFARSVLENGMTLVTLRNDASPLFAAHLTVRNRAAIDGGQPGALNLVHGLLEHGMAGCDEECLANRLRDLGLQLKLVDDPRFPMDNYYTNGRFSFIRAETSAENGPQALSLLLELIQHASFNVEAVADEKQAQRELLARSSRSTRARAGDLMSRALYGEHPMANPPEGRLQSLDEITYDDLRRVYRRAFTPSNLILSVVSPLPHDETAAVIEGQLGGRGDLNLDIPPLPITGTPARIEDLNGGQMGSVRLGSLFRIDPADAPALRLLVSVLSQRQGMDLRETRGLSSRATWPSSTAGSIRRRPVSRKGRRP